MSRKPIKTPGAQAPAENAAEDTSAVDAAEGLPNEIDIDPKAIDSPVMTRQGWVVPDAAHREKVRKLEEMRRELGAT